MLKFFCWKNVSSFCKATHIFSAKNIRILCIESAKTVYEMIFNEIVKLTTLWTTGPRPLLSIHTFFGILWFRWQTVKTCSGCMDAQTYLDCHFQHMPEDTFKHGMAHMYLSISFVVRKVYFPICVLGCNFFEILFVCVCVCVCVHSNR